MPKQFKIAFYSKVPVFDIQILFIQGQPYLSATSSEISDKRTFTTDDRDSSHDSAA